ncbi:unnamed protein product [Medioppia subpectinata]|uniref:Uncharacterized protein n=1 Tax=Medioppia subpectinata TaxID=1979941 RepID=A0A7R9LQ86_9ACAR|nr:unnamed protein product [Medioppia subpectinata]CAG2120715.1 unnamed protein product [Medioppia subpectinata]
MCPMGRNCCCFDSLWLKAHKARPTHPNHCHSGKVYAIDSTTTSGQLSGEQTLCSVKKRHHFPNGFTQNMRHSCDRNNSRKSHFSSYNNNNNNNSYFGKKYLNPNSTKPEKKEWKTECLLYSILFVVSIVCFANSLSGDFVHDDIVAIINNPDVLAKTPLYKLFLHDFWGKPMADPILTKVIAP